MTVPAGQSAGDGFAERGGHGLPDIGRTPHAANSRGGHDFVFFFRRARAAADDGAGMTHAASGRRSLSGDEANHRLAHASPNEFRGLLLGIAADLADHDDGMRIGIIVEEAHGIQKRCADDGIAANANAGGLSYAQVHELADGVGGQRAALARGDAGDHARAVSDHLPRLEATFAAREALREHTSQFVYQNAHRAPPARRTAFSAPSFISSPMVKLRPESRKIWRPCSTLVPSMRTTTGSFICNSRAAATTPVASTSQRRMPPKMLMKTLHTSLSLVRILKALFTWSAEAPPPTSRKFAGAPPASLMMSIVAMARPAPLTMQPTVPSSLM